MIRAFVNERIINKNDFFDVLGRFTIETLFCVGLSLSSFRFYSTAANLDCAIWIACYNSCWMMTCLGAEIGYLSPLLDCIFWFFLVVYIFSFLDDWFDYYYFFFVVFEVFFVDFRAFLVNDCLGVRKCDQTLSVENNPVLVIDFIYTLRAHSFD